MANEKQLMPTYHPTIFIGLGGAGGAIVNRIAGILKNSSNWGEIEEIFQFFVLDTDRAMIDDCPNVPFAHRFIVSGFDKGVYSAMKRGSLGHEAGEPDPRVVQWLHPWYNFRSSRGAGAGQIRVESRLSIHNALEAGNLIARLRSAVSRTLHYNIPNVDTRTKELRVFFYFSVAGGTGSGSHLVMAYLMQHLAEQFGLKANLTAVAILPTLFMDVIRNHRQQTDVLCNGYAALKEIEHLMKLKVTSDERDPKNKREFIYHPHAEQTEVKEPPFDFVYLIDTPPDLNVGGEFRSVVADGIYLQLASPIFAVRGSDFDNYEKNQKRFAAGLYSTYYGTFGCSVLVLPDHDILDYCTLKQAEGVFVDYFQSSIRTSDGKRFPTEKEEQEWSELDEKLRGRHLDLAYLRFVLHEHNLNGNSAGTGTKGKNILGATKKIFRVAGADPAKLAAAGVFLDPDGREGLFNKAVRELSALEDFEGVAVGTPEFPSIRADLAVRAAAETAADLLYDVQTKSLRQNDELQDMEDEGFDDNAAEDEWGAKVLVYSGWRALTQEALFGPHGLVNELENILTPPPPPQGPGEYERRADPGIAVDVIVQHAGQLKSWSEDLDSRLRRWVSDVETRFGTTGSVVKLLSDKAEDIDLQTLRLYFTALREELLFVHDATDRMMQNRRLIAKVADDVKRIFNRLKNSAFEDLGPGGIEHIRKEAKVEFMEKLPGTRDEHQKFLKVWEADFVERRNEWVNTIQSYHCLEGVKLVCKAILNPVEKFLETLRTFNRFATQKRLAIQREVARYLEEAGQEANQFVVDVEVLQNLQGERLWDRYYNSYIAEQRRLPTDKVLKILTDVFLDEQLNQRPDDIAEAIKKRVMEISRENLHDAIAGRYSTGEDRSKRGLLIDEAIKKEAEICFVDSLKASGRFDDMADTYAIYKDNPQSDLASVQSFRDELNGYTTDYLQLKLGKCLRTSGILANIDMNSREVTEYACRQAIMAYDQKLYGAPESNPAKRLDHFPSAAVSIEDGIQAYHWNSEEGGKRVIFYQALLGVPLYVFKNIREMLREAYNRRVEERNPLEPQSGRMYPLHIDKNWEPEEPDQDPGKLPLSLDPDEALQSKTGTDEKSKELLLQFLTLLEKHQISWTEGKGFFVKPGRLGNPADMAEVRLGTGLKAALHTIQANPAVVEVVKKEAGQDLLSLDKLRQLRDAFSKHVQPDVWNRNKDASAEALETANLLEEMVLWAEGGEADKRKGKTEPCLGKLFSDEKEASEKEITQANKTDDSDG